MTYNDTIPLTDHTLRDLTTTLREGEPRPWITHEIGIGGPHNEVTIMRVSSLISGQTIIDAIPASNAALIVAAVNALPSLITEVNASRERPATESKA